MNKKSHGFSLLEIIIALVIFGIAGALMSSANTKNIHRTKISTTTEEAQLFAADMDSVISEIGIPSSNQRSDALDFINALEQEYLNFTFDHTTLVLSASGFTIMTQELKDGFDQPFMFYVSTAPNNARVMLISAAADMKFETASYAGGSFGDDIITIVKERN